MSNLTDIALNLLKIAYEHDPNILKEHEQAAREKLEQLDSETIDTSELQKTYQEKLKELLNKPVSPEEVSDMLHVFDKEKPEDNKAEVTDKK